MKCPNAACRKEIPFDAVQHDSCGWRATEREPGCDDEMPAPELEPTQEERRAAYERVRAALEEVRRRPVPTPRERWQAIADNPRAGFRAHELAREALAETERREAIRHDAEIQELARRIVAEQGSLKADDEAV